MLIDIPRPIVLVKHSTSGDCSTFELWYIPEGAAFEKLLDAGVASTLLLTFEGDFEEARQECRTYIDQKYPHHSELWVAKETKLEAVEQD